MILYRTTQQEKDALVPSKLDFGKILLTRHKRLSSKIRRDISLAEIGEQGENKVAEILKEFGNKDWIYPDSWLSVKDINDKSQFRNLHVIPNTKDSNAVNQYQVMYSGIAPMVGYFGNNFIPNYWEISYCTGWDSWEIPEDIIDDDGELIILQVVEEKGETILCPIEDDNVFDEVGKIFEERLSDLFLED